MTTPALNVVACNGWLAPRDLAALATTATGPRVALDEARAAPGFWRPVADALFARRFGLAPRAFRAAAALPPARPEQLRRLAERCDDAQPACTPAVVDVGRLTVRAGSAGAGAPAMRYPAAIGVTALGEQLVGREGLARVHEVNDVIWPTDEQPFALAVLRGTLEDVDPGHAAGSLFLVDELRGSAAAMLRQRARTAEMVFEHGLAERLAVRSQQACAAAAAGVATGTVLHVGVQATTAACVLDGRLDAASAVRSGALNAFVTSAMLLQLLRGRAPDDMGPRMFQLVPEVKARCRVARTRAAAEERFHTESVTLSTGLELDVPLELVPEPLFSDAVRILGLDEGDFVPRLLARGLRGFPERAARDVVLAGASTCYPGFAERLRAELAGADVPAAHRLGAEQAAALRILAPGADAAWRGAAALATQPDAGCFFSRQEYQESGDALWHRHRERSEFVL